MPPQNASWKTPAISEELSNSLGELANNSSEPIGYAGLEMLVAACRHMGTGRLLTVEEGTQVNLVTGLISHKRPFQWFETWLTPLSVLGPPVSRKDCEIEALSAAFEYLDAPVLLREVPVGGPTHELLRSKFNYFRTLEQWQRAALKTDGSFDDWLMANFSHKRRKELKRLRARLSEQGALVSESLTRESELKSYCDDFLRLEASGWKGDKGTAIAKNVGLTATFHDGIASLFRNGRLRFWRITFNGEAIAILFATISAGRATLGKIAYDEAYAKYSPGVMVILDATAAMFADPAINFADSNAIPGHPMIDNIWRDRHDCADILVAPPSTTNLKFNSVLFFETRKRTLRKTAKRIYNRLRGD